LNLFWAESRFWSNRPPYFSQLQNNLGRTKQHFFCEQSAVNIQKIPDQLRGICDMHLKQLVTMICKRRATVVANDVY